MRPPATEAPVLVLLGYEIEPPVPDGSVLIGAPELMARIRLLEYPVVPVVAAGVIGQQIVDCRVLVSVPVFR